MGFLIRMAFWFSLVLLALPLAPAGGDAPGINPIQAFFAAKEAVNDVAAICERKPDVCEVGKAAMQTIGSRAKESARIAYRMLEESDVPAQADAVGSVAESAEPANPSTRDAASTGSVNKVSP